jgi:protoporphyrinogen oxidase
MKIAILGGGLTGLTAAYHLAQKGTAVSIFEKNKTLGGLAGGTKRTEWDWYLDYTYHHIFTTDTAILQLAAEIGHQFSFKTPHTDTLFGEKNNYRIFPVDTPKDFLLLPELSILSRLRAGAVLAFLKLSPFLSLYETQSASVFLQKTMGQEVWKTLWQPLFRKKFGDYAEIVVASFIWARINKRTQSLGYPTGGFQSLVNRLAEHTQKRGVAIYTEQEIVSIHKKGERFIISTKQGKEELFDRIIATIPYPIFLPLVHQVLPREYIVTQSKQRYLWAVNMIVATEKPILEKTYWLNVNAADVPVMCVVQHTNFVSASHFGGKHITYFAWYVAGNDPLLSQTEEQMIERVQTCIARIHPGFLGALEPLSLFRVPYAQPIFDTTTAKLSHALTTPDPHIFVANLDMTYPFDRGTNYAVQLGKEVSCLV